MGVFVKGVWNGSCCWMQLYCRVNTLCLLKLTHYTLMTTFLVRNVLGYSSLITFLNIVYI